MWWHSCLFYSIVVLEREKLRNTTEIILSTVFTSPIPLTITHEPSIEPSSSTETDLTLVYTEETQTIGIF